MQPIDYKQLLIIIVAAISFIIGYNIPTVKNIYLDIIVRSSITTIIFFAMILVMKVSDDINERYIVYKNYLLKYIHH